MFYKNPLRDLGVASVAASLLLGMQPVMASDTTELADRFAATEKAVNAKDVQAWADAMYAENVVVIGEGSEEAVRGLDALMPIMNEIVNGAESCSIEMNDSEINDNQAWSFATWSCKPVEGDSYQVRALYVWEQQDSKWQVVAEMYGMGAMK